MPTGSLPRLDFRRLYDHFDAPVADVDCGAFCAPHNPGGKPFCCDICHAVPAVYYQEWAYLRQSTSLWHEWRGDECGESTGSVAEVRSETPDNMLLLACEGPEYCQRRFRALSCREFPFFPYLSSDYRFLGLAYDWTFEARCWVISHLDQVTETYRRELVSAFDELFSLWPEEMDGYAGLSETLREVFWQRHRRIPLLHRNGGYYLISPASEDMRRVDPQRLPRFGPYR
jgi:hypothetical protein